MIRFEGAGKRFGDKAVLHDIDLHIEAGSLTTVIGGSGSGKTTLLRLINGLITPDKGHVRVRGQDVITTDLVQLRRSIGYVIQEAGLFPHLRVAGNIAYVPRLLGWPKEKIQQRIVELAKAVRLDAGLLSHYPHQLSGGQRQRVGIARALTLPGQTSFSWTSPLVRWMKSPVRRCRLKSRASGKKAAPPSSSSPTTSTRRWILAASWWCCTRDAWLHTMRHSAL